MKTTVIISFFLFFFLLSSRAQQKLLQFDFDAAGNQITRTWVCVNCLIPQGNVKPGTLVSQHQDSIMREILLNKTLSLHVDTHLSRIYLLHRGGAVSTVARFFLTDRQNRIVLSGDRPVGGLDLSGVPPGTYLLCLEYPDGERKEIGLRKI